MQFSSLSPHVRGTILVLAGAICISVSPLFVKLVDAGPGTVGFYRMFWGGIVLLSVAIFKGQRIIPGKIPLICMLLASVFFCADLLFWHFSILYIGPGLATILSNFQVFFLAIYSAVVLKDKLGTRMIVAIPLALFGLLLLLDQDPRHLPHDVAIGIVLGIVSGLFYAGYLVSVRRSQSVDGHLPAAANMGFISIVGSVILAVTCTSMGENLLVASLHDQLWMLLYGLSCQALGLLLMTSGLPLVPTARGGLLILIQPALSFIWDIIIFGRATSALGYCGAVLALGAICLGSVGAPKRKPRA